MKFGWIEWLKVGKEEVMKDGTSAKQQKVKVAKEAEENKNKNSINGSLYFQRFRGGLKSFSSLSGGGLVVLSLSIAC